ncbi:MAG: hypothetical protein EXQ70_09715 [Solirubrobacterales bacterium]|nr:hypothetical protein [Solirubrobacterales bacterium]
MAERDQAAPDWRARANFQGGVYGTILATALVAAYSSDSSLSAEEVGVGVAATVVVFWLAHAYAGMIAGGLSGRRPGLGAARDALGDEWPIVASAIPLLIALALGAVGLVTDATAETLAVLVGVVGLVAYGVVIGIKRRFSTLGIVALAAVNGLFGVVIVALKVFVH